MSSRRSELSVRGLKVRYSPGEENVFSFLLERPRDSETLTRLHYGGKRAEPFNGRRVVSGLLSSLARKVALNREPFRVRSSARAGPNPKTFWLEPLARRQRRAGEVPGASLALATSREGGAGQ